MRGAWYCAWHDPEAVKRRAEIKKQVAKNYKASAERKKAMTAACKDVPTEVLARIDVADVLQRLASMEQVNMEALLDDLARSHVRTS